MRVAVTCTAGAILAFAVGYVLGRTQERGPVRTQNVQQPRAAAGAEHGFGEPAEQLLSAALENIPSHGHVRGNGYISGHVVDRNDVPMAGVVVMAFAASSSPWDGLGQATEADELEPAVRGFVEWWRTNVVPVCETITGTDGRFVLDGLADSGYRVIARYPNHMIRPRGSMGNPITHSGDSLDLVAEPRVPVECEVIMQDGTQPPHASIVFHGDTFAGAEDWTPSRRTVSLTPGTYKVRGYVECGNGETLTSQREDVVVGAMSPNSAVRLQIQSAIHGVVTFADRRLRGLRAYALPFDGQDTPREDRLLRDGTMVLCDGSYYFGHLPAGHYLVGIASKSEVVVSTKVVHVGGDPARCDFDLASEDQRRFMRLAVRDPRGLPLNDVEIVARVPETGRTCQDAGVALGAGAFLVVCASDTSGESQLVLEVVSATYGRIDLSCRRGQAADHLVTFREAARLDVEITNEPSVALWVGVSRSEGDRTILWSSSERGVGGGGFEIEPLQPGVYSLLVFSRIGRYHSAIAARREVAVSPGANRIRVGLPPFHTLTVTGFSEGDLVWLRGGASAWRPAVMEIGRDGIGTWFLPEGQYAVGRGAESMALDLEFSMTAEFKPGP